MVRKRSRNAVGQQPSERQKRESDKSEELCDPEVTLLRQPQTRPISWDNLVTELIEIHAELSMVETKCIEVDTKQTIAAQDQNAVKRDSMRNYQWRSLIVLHSRLIDKHHEFFLASHHPLARKSLEHLVVEHDMQARMWRHGIQAFLDVLRGHLPESQEHMLTFIHFAYSMMLTLLDINGQSNDRVLCWLESLGDLSRYGMAFVDDVRDKELWSGVARYWYSRKADKIPTIGRLYHHLAIVAKPYTLEQLSLYLRALTCAIPLEEARKNLMALFDPILRMEDFFYRGSISMEILVIKAHGLLFTYPARPTRDFEAIQDQLQSGLIDAFVIGSCVEFRRIGVFFAVSNIAALLEFGTMTSNGSYRSKIYRALKHLRLQSSTDIVDGTQAPGAQNIESRVFIALQSEDTLTPEEAKTSSTIFTKASELTFNTLEVCLKESHWQDNHIMPMFHVMLVFIWSIGPLSCAIEMLDSQVPWVSICAYLNRLLRESDTICDMIWDSRFPISPEAQDPPLPEDYIIRGQDYTAALFPQMWFENAGADDEERLLEKPSTDVHRRVRCLWLGARLCTVTKGRWLRFDQKAKIFLMDSDVDPGSDCSAPVDGTDTGVDDIDKLNTSIENVDVGLKLSRLNECDEATTLDTPLRDLNSYTDLASLTSATVDQNENEHSIRDATLNA